MNELPMPNAKCEMSNVKSPTPNPYGSVPDAERPTPTYYTFLDSPIQRTLLTSDGTSLTGFFMNTDKHGQDVDKSWVRNDKAKPFPEAREQVSAYFEGRLKEFDLPLAPNGTEFQRRVWKELEKIPFAATISYGELARRIGKPNASRAVGLANGSNPIAIIVPCHRVIGANGKLTGYGGGLPRKESLLAFEASVVTNGPRRYAEST